MGDFMIFVRAQQGPPNSGDPDGMFTVQYFDEKGNMTIRSNGSRAWRCNNPGNLLKGPYSMGKSRRSIGFAGDSENAYAIYPDYNTGHEALVVMLKGSVYSPLTLRAAMIRYEPKKRTYIDDIVKITGLDPDRKIRSLNNKEFDAFWKAIERVEYWDEGVEEFIERWIILGVHKKSGIVFEYLVNTSNSKSWITKEHAIQLATEGRLHTVLVHLKSGTTFLRPEYGKKRFETIA